MVKKILISIGILLSILYLSFLFVVPHAIKADKYLPQVKQVLKENTDLNIEVDDIKVYTTPLLEAGLKIEKPYITLPDGSWLFYSKKIKAKVFLPSLLWFDVRVTEVNIDEPWINLPIENNEQFKVVRTYENLINRIRKDKLAHPEKYAKAEETTNSPIDLSKIKINLDKIKLNNLVAVINDNQSKLSLGGNNLTFAYHNGKTAKIKGDLGIFLDGHQRITANLDIDSSLPKITIPEKEEEDLEAVYSIPFINPVEVYKDYNLKSNINAKLKIRQKDKIKINGFLDIEDTTITMSGLELPKSYFKLIGYGYQEQIDSNIYVTDKEYINLSGKINHSIKSCIDLTVKSPQVHFANVLNIARAYLDTIHIKTDLDNMSADGYFLANANIKTDFRTLQSSGKIVVREGNIADKNIGLIFDDIKGNLILDGNIFKLDDTHVLINGRPLYISGQISNDALANFEIKGDKLPLKFLYKAFAPKDLKNKYILEDGTLTTDIKVVGEVKQAMAILKADIDNFRLKDIQNAFILTNKNMHLGIANCMGQIKGRLKNTGFGLSLPALHTILADKLLIADIDNKNIAIEPSILLFNKNSAISFDANIKNYLSDLNAKFKANGHIAASDLGIVIGEVGVPYFDIKGNLPIKANATADSKKFDLIAQILADNKNYITPVIMKEFAGKQTIAQLNIKKNNDTLKIENTGLYTRNEGQEFSDNLSRNTIFAKEVVALRSIITNVTFQPFISLFKVTLSNDLEGSIFIFKRSKFKAHGHLQAYGKPNKPYIKGNFVIDNFELPEALIKIEKIITDINTKDIDFYLNNINANGSYFNVSGKTNWNLISKATVYKVAILSRFIDVNKLLKLTETVTKNFPTSEPNREKRGIEERTNFPLEVLDGSIRFSKIVMDKIVVDNTSADIAILKNILYVNKLKTNPLGGVVTGQAKVDLIDMKMAAKVSGKNFDVKKLLFDLMNMKDTLTGKMNFNADLSLEGTEIQEQMRSLKGTIDFNIKEGQLGPFGKFENFLMAENIRENPFFSTAIGSVINNLLSFDTSRFNELYGHLSFNNGVADISPIKSQGNVMSMFIFGNLNLLDNSAEMKVRGKLASAFSDKLGPLSNINPINLVKHTPGVNVALAKTFVVFCESLSDEEMAAIPQLAEDKSDHNATKFQIRLKGDTRKPLKMIKSFKWLATDSEIESAQEFVDTIPTPEEGEEGMSIEELIELRAQQAEIREQEAKKPINKIRKIFGYQPK